MNPGIKSARYERKTLTEAAELELRQAILRGTFGPGSRLPTEAELGELLHVSRTVVREALRILEEDGLITRRHGVGTFVRKHPIEKNLNLNFGITEMIASAGLKPGTSHMAILEESATDETAEQLNVALGSPLTTIERVRTADDRPVVYSLDTISAELLAKNGVNRERLLSASIYQIIQEELGQVIGYGIARIQPVAATAQAARLLAIPVNTPLLYLVQTDYSPADEPLIFSREYHLPDAFDFLIWRRGPANLRPFQSGSSA